MIKNNRSVSSTSNLNRITMYIKKQLIFLREKRCDSIWTHRTNNLNFVRISDMYMLVRVILLIICKRWWAWHDDNDDEVAKLIYFLCITLLFSCHSFSVSLIQELSVSARVLYFKCFLKYMIHSLYDFCRREMCIFTFKFKSNMI